MILENTYFPIENVPDGLDVIAEHVIKNMLFSPTLHLAALLTPSTGTITTSIDPTATANIRLIDTAATFIADGVLAGQICYNATDDSVAIVISVDSETQLTTTKLVGGTDNTWTSADSYTVNAAPGQVVLVKTANNNKMYRRNDANTAWVQVGAGGFDVTVGLANSGADFEVDGTADEVQIQAAIDLVKTAGIGIVKILAGSYSTSALITWKAGVVLDFRDVILVPTGDFNVIQNEDQVATTDDYFMIGILEIDATNATSSTTNLIELIKVNNFNYNARITLKNGGARGVYIKAGTNGNISEIYADGTHDPLFIFDTSNQITVGKYTAKNCDSDGGQVRSSKGVCVLNMNLQNNQRNGFLASSVTDCYFQGICANNNQEATSDFHGFAMNKVGGGVDSERNVIDVVCFDDQATATQTTGIKLTSDCKDNIYRVQGFGNINGLVDDEGSRNINAVKESMLVPKELTLDIIQAEGTDNSDKVYLTNAAAQQITFTKENMVGISIFTSKSNAGAGDLNCTLYEWDTNYATTIAGPVIAKQTILEADLTAITWQFFDLAKNRPLKIDFSKQHLAVFEGTAGDATDNYRIFRTTTDVYPSNSFFRNAGSELATADARFVTHYARDVNAEQKEPNIKRFVFAKNSSGSALVKGDVVTIKNSASDGDTVDTTTVHGDSLIYAVCLGDIANNRFTYFQVKGKTEVDVKVNGVIDIAVGDLLGTFTDVGVAAKVPDGFVGGLISLGTYTTDDSNGTIRCLVIPPRIKEKTTETRTGAGALDPFIAHTFIVTTGTDALTLADGIEGMEKFIYMKTDGGVGTLTPANLANGSTLTFDDVGDSAHLEFMDGSWIFFGGTATLA